MTDCRFCSVISKANGEDPIGTAGTFDRWLILEMKQPWPAAMWVEDPRLQPLVAAIKQLMLRHGLRIRPLAIAPDQEYSQPNQARLLYYRRPSRRFAEFEKQEFVVPESKLQRLLIE